MNLSQLGPGITPKDLESENGRQVLLLWIQDLHENLYKALLEIQELKKNKDN